MNKNFLICLVKDIFPSERGKILFVASRKGFFLTARAFFPSLFFFCHVKSNQPPGQSLKLSPRVGVSFYATGSFKDTTICKCVIDITRCDKEVIVIGKRLVIFLLFRWEQFWLWKIRLLYVKFDSVFLNVRVSLSSFD